MLGQLGRGTEIANGNIPYMLGPSIHVSASTSVRAGM